jgi:hypothetical protein
VFQGAATAEQRMEAVALLRTHATLMLANAAKRIPVDKPSIIAAYKAERKELAWMLDDDNDDAIRFCLTLPNFSPTDAERKAAGLLRACVVAQEAGDVREFRQMRAGIKQAETNRIKGTSGKLTEAERQRIGKTYWYLDSTGQGYGATKELASTYNVTPKTIKTIADDYKRNSIGK